MEHSQLSSEHLQGSQDLLVQCFPFSEVAAAVDFPIVQLTSVLPVYVNWKIFPYDFAM